MRHTLLVTERDSTDSPLLFRIKETTSSDTPDCVRFNVEVLYSGAIFTGQPATLDFRQLEVSLGADNNYGRCLGTALLNATAVPKALNLLGGRAVPIGLQLDQPDGRLGSLRWERIELPGWFRDPLSVSPNTPFCRSVANQPQDAPPQDQVFRLLVVVASPNAEGIYQIDPIVEAASVVNACSELLKRYQMEITLLLGAKVKQSLPPELAREGVRLISGASTAERIGGLILADSSGKPYHGLHIIAHGSYNQEIGCFYLLLEDERGGLFSQKAEDLIRNWQPQRLRLIFLESCQSAVSGGAQFDAFRDHVTGFMQLLVEAGVPAVVAMQDSIKITDAKLFNQGFYSALLQTGRVDTAANNGRQLLRDSADSAWSIPALTARLRGGDVWAESPLRKANRLLCANLEQAREDRQLPDFPVDVCVVPSQTAHSAIDSSSDVAQTGVREDLHARVSVLLGKPPADELYWLAGDAGSAKSTFLETVFLEQCVANFQETQPAVPVLLTLQDCISNSVSAAAAIAGAISSYFAQRTGFSPDPAYLADQFGKREFLFLIDGGTEFTQGTLRDALKTLGEFRSSANQPHRFMVCLDDNSFDADDLPPSTAFLLIQPMSPERVVGYLSKLQGDPSCRYRAAAGRLVNALRENGLFDLAESPWLLAEMLNAQQRGHQATSRAAIIEQVIKERLRRVSKPTGVPTRAPDALYRIAWEIQNTAVGSSSGASFSGALTYRTLAEIRGNRDFLLSEFRQALIVQSGLLKGTEDDGVRFSYTCFCAYATAKYIDALPDAEQERILDGITATLGRHSRVDWWSETLVLLAGLQPDSEETGREKTRRLLRMILSGSLLNEGDQVFVAAKCLHEARLARNDPSFLGDSTIVRSVISSLVHRSHPQSWQPVNVRKGALRHLAPLRDESAVPHLISLAAKKVRIGRGGRPEFDLSGMRMAAIKALLYTPDAAIRALDADTELRDNAGLHEIVSHWVQLKLDGLMDEFRRPDPLEASIAAFALGITKPSGALDLLASRFRPEECDKDLLWAIADSMVELGDPGLEKVVESSLTVPPLWAFAAYLIGKLGASYGHTGFQSFLRDRVNDSQGEPGVRGRALQSLAELDNTVAGAEKLRDVCDQWLESADDQLRYYAVQGLRYAGDESTLAKLEGLQWNATNTPIFERLRHEVYEELYWRLAGGLSSEVMTLY